MVLIVAQFRAAYKKLKTMKEPTMEEVLELVSFYRDEDGKLRISDVYDNVRGNLRGSVDCNVWGNVWGDVWGEVKGKVLNSLD